MGYHTLFGLDVSLPFYSALASMGWMDWDTCSPKTNLEHVPGWFVLPRKATFLILVSFGVKQTEKLLPFASYTIYEVVNRSFWTQQ